MRIAIIGSGISGLTCAHYLTKAGHSPTVFESNDYIGGHTHTVTVKGPTQDYAVDTGFIVFNSKTYPNFIRLLNELNVPYQATDMSFSVYDPANQFQYAGGSLNGLFAERRNLFSPKFYTFLYEIRRFQRLARQLLREKDKHLSLGEFIKQHRFQADVCENYLYPLIASLWSSPGNLIDAMPIYFVANFFENHSLLDLIPALNWNVIQAGSARYVEALTQAFINNIHLNTTISHVKRSENGWELSNQDTLLGVFDKVIIATHSDDALAMLDEPSTLTKDILSAFSYQDNHVLLHQDKRILPSNHRAWASWNYWIAPENDQQAILTYNMNRLQGIPDEVPCYVSLNAKSLINPSLILQEFNYRHPQYTQASLGAQARQVELNQHAGLYFCGAYWGYGFHEDGVNSARVVCKQLLNTTDLDD